jgi:hypothetical protein
VDQKPRAPLTDPPSSLLQLTSYHRGRR